ncbi:fibronectin type III domain protein [Vibrio ponticus]|nr:fibronectin type III domain protein [Vibrio ponticus]
MKYISINGQEKTVLEITINSDFTSASFGQVDVELHLPIDHPITDESDILNIKVPIQATDFDGDVSDVKYLEIGIEDTVPNFIDPNPNDNTEPDKPINYAFDVSEGEEFSHQVIDYLKGDGLSKLEITISEPNAGYSIDNPIVVTNEQINNSANGGVIHREAVWGKVEGSDQSVEIGYLILIKSDEKVEVKFEASPLIDHDKVVSQANFTITATDKDGDTDTGSININIKDAEASLDVKPIQGVEDASYLLLGMVIELPDNDGEQINSIKFSSEVTGGDFYYKNGSEYIQITPDTDLLAANLTLETVDTTISIKNVFFKPNAEYSSDGEIISTKVTVNLSGENHTDQSIESDVKISIEGKADLPTKDASYQDKTSGNEDSLIQLNFAYKTQDQAKYTNDDTTDDTPETIVYTLSVPEGHILVNASGVEFSKDANGNYLFVKNSEITLFDPTENLAGINKLENLSEVYLKPIEDFSGSVHVEVTATSHERYSDDTASQSSSITVDVKPVAEGVGLEVERVRVLEDNEFQLSLHINLQKEKFLTKTFIKDKVTGEITVEESIIERDSSDESESMYVYLKGLPDGTVINNINADGENAIIVNGKACLLSQNDGSAGEPIELQDPTGEAISSPTDVDLVIAYDQILDKANPTTITPPKDSNEDFNFKVEGVLVDKATFSDGSKEYHIYSTGDETIFVDIKGVADNPLVEKEGSEIWQIESDSGVVSSIKTTVAENTDSVSLDFSILGGEKNPSDTSETISLVIYGAPGNGEYELLDSENDNIKLTYVGQENGQPKYEVEITDANAADKHKFDLSGIKVKPAANNTDDIHLIAKVVSTENDGNENITKMDIIIHVEPDISGFSDDYRVTTSLNEDSNGSIHWYPGNLSDSDSNDLADNEFVSEFVIEAGMTDFPITINVSDHVVVKADGEIITGEYKYDGTKELTFTAKDGKPLTASDIELLPQLPTDSSKDAELSTKITVSEKDVDGNYTVVEKPYNGKLEINVTPVVEPDRDAKLLLEPRAGLDPTAEHSDEVRFTINKSSAELGDTDYSINFNDLDSNSDEIVDQLVVTFSAANATQLATVYVEGAVSNGDGSWTIVSKEDFAIHAPHDLTGKLGVKISAQVIDMGEDVNDRSEPVTKEINFELDFANYTGPGDTAQKAATPEFESGNVLSATEDKANGIDLKSYLATNLSLDSDTLTDMSSDKYYLVFEKPAEGSPYQIASEKGHTNFLNGKLTIEIAFDSDGNLIMSSLGDLSLVTDADFAGDFKLPIIVIAKDASSGDEKKVESEIAVEVTPQVDGVNAQMQVNAVEDVAGGILIDINQLGFMDKDTDVNRGVESFTEVLISLPQGGEIGSLSVSDLYASYVTFEANGAIRISASDEVDIDDVLASITYHPPEHYSGTVNLTVTGKVVDATVYDNGTEQVDIKSNPSEFTSTVVVNIASQVDGVVGEAPIDHDNIVEGMASGEIRDVINLSTIEDSRGDNVLSLSDLSFTLKDQDGSEEFVSFKLTGLPEDFLVQSTSPNFSVSNNGNGEWSIKIKGDLGYSTTLDGINIIPPENFSGTTEIKYVVFTQEKDTQTPIGQQGSINLAVTPQGDDVDTRIGTTATGEEGEFVEIKLDARIVDKELSIASDNEHTENAPETVHITVSNVPDGVNVVIPGFDSDSYSATKELVGSDKNGVAQYTWTITTNAQVVNSIVLDLTDTDYNSNFWPGDSASVTVTVRSDDNGDLGETTTQDVSLNITPVNDKPEVKAGITELSVQEDSLIAITDIVVSDKDEKENPDAIVSVTFVSENGVLSFSAQALAAFESKGQDFKIITNQQTGAIEVSGTISSINQLLDGSLVDTISDQGLQFKPEENYVGEASISVVVNDNSNGTNGLLDESSISDELTINIDVTAVNDTPTVSGPTEFTINEDKEDFIITTIQVGDADIQPDSSAEVKVTLSAELGAITFESPYHNLQPTNTGDFVLTGTLADINAILANGVIYKQL